MPLVCAKGFEAALVEKLKSPPKPVPDWPDGWKEGMLCGAACPKAVAVGVAARLLRPLLGFRVCAILLGEEYVSFVSRRCNPAQ